MNDLSNECCLPRLRHGTAGNLYKSIVYNNHLVKFVKAAVIR